MMEKTAKILIVGHDDILENALYEYWLKEGFSQVMSASRLALDCAIQPAVNDFFQSQRPDYIFLGSTRSGGIQANCDMPAEFSYHNVQSASNVLHAAYKFQAKKVLYYASSCIYPREADQPLQPSQLLSGPLEPTSEPYALAKLAGVTMARSFRRQYGLNTVIMIPATVYGPGGEDDLQTAHVLGALIHKFSVAVREGESKVLVWGSGNPCREFLHRDDFLTASRLMMEDYEGEDIINVGTGEDVRIADLAAMIAKAVGFAGEIEFDASRPDGAARKLLDNQMILKLGWQPQVGLEQGIQQTVKWCKDKGVL